MSDIKKIKDFNIRITDMNMYLGKRDCYSKEVDIKELLRVMDHYSISRAVCSHEYCLLNPKEGNTLMKEEADKSGGRIGVAAFLDLILCEDCLPGEGNLTERLRTFAPEAVRIMPGDRAVFSAFYWDEILDPVNELKLPLILDCEYTPQILTELPKVAAEYPNIKFILVHYGMCRSRNIFPLLKKCSNVYFTIESMMDNLQIEEISEKFGVEKLLFGSAYPKYSPAGPLGLGLYANISDDDKAKIMYKNWESIKG